MTKLYPAGTNQATYAYDSAGRLSSRTDAKSQAISYTYNDRNELTNITYPDSSYVSFAYNDAGARTQMVDSTGTTSYSYDSLYRLTSVTFPGSRTVGYGYDDAGRRTSITYPGGTNQATHAYDNANRLTSVTDWNSRAVAYAYDDAGRMTTATLPSSTGIVSTYSYDNADRLTGIAHVQNGSTTIASVAYTLDAVGNRTQRVDQQGTHTYAYDNLYRLTSVTYPGPTTTSYAFDAFGNRTSMTDGTGTTAYAYDDAERLTSVTPPTPAPVVNYTWDNNGDLTQRGSDSFAWDYEDRMTSATVGGITTTFTYRGDGLRNSRTTGGVTTGFTWDVNRGLPVVLDDGNQYVYGAGLASMVSGSGTYYHLADGLGSTMAIVDTSGTVQKSYTYDVYGKSTATGSLANEFDFAGQQTDPTGLQYLRARYMDPAAGRFPTRDPASRSPSTNAAPYTYAGGSPASLVDPSGLCSVWSFGDIWDCVKQGASMAWNDFDEMLLDGIPPAARGPLLDAWTTAVSCLSEYSTARNASKSLDCTRMAIVTGFTIIGCALGALGGGLGGAPIGCARGFLLGVQATATLNIASTVASGVDAWNQCKSAFGDKINGQSVATCMVGFLNAATSYAVDPYMSTLFSYYPPGQTY